MPVPTVLTAQKSRTRHFAGYLAKLFCILALAMIWLPITAPKPARADILACINALTGLKTVVEVAKELADPGLLACTQQMAAGDVVMIGTVALIVGAGQAGAFNNEDTCNNMVTGPLGQFIADILTGAGPLSTALKAAIGESNFAKLVEFAKGQAVDQVTSIGPLQPIFGYMNCGCKVYGKGKAIAAAAGGYFDDVKECAGVIKDMGEAIINLAESGANAVAEAFGHEQDGPVATLTDNYPQCGNWQYFPANSVQSSSQIKSTVVTGYHTEVVTCQCAAPSRLEVKDAFDGKVAARCACDVPSNSFYNSKLGTCGCPANLKLQGGSCIACESEVRTETAKGASVVSGYVSNGVCTPISRVCEPGTKPVRSSSDYYYECKPVCDTGTFFIRATNGIGGSCGACPMNLVPNSAALFAGKLECSECPRGTVSKPGDKQCVALECANGIDLENPHACKSPCVLLGEGKNKRLVCTGANINTQIQCPATFVLQGGKCVPEIYHKPDVIIQEGMDYQRLPTKPLDPRIRRTTPNIDTRARPDRNGPERDLTPRRNREQTRRDRAEDDVLIGPVDEGSRSPRIGDIIDFGATIGRGLQTGPGIRGERSNRGGGALEALPQSTDGPSRRRLPAEDIPRQQRLQKD